MRRLLWAVLVGFAVVSGAAAQGPQTCDEELRAARWLTRHYFEERTSLELALAASEARRQAVEARLKALEEAMKTAPKGQK